jgi:hypothetical protein
VCFSILVDPTVVISNSNHSTGPSLSSASAGNDHKMVPAAIGSERKRHMPTSTTVVPPMATSDWSSASKRKLYHFLLPSNLFFTFRTISLSTTTTTTTTNTRLSTIEKQ